MTFNGFFSHRKNLAVILCTAILLISTVLLLNLSNFSGFLKYEILNDKSKLSIRLSLANPTVNVLAADPENKLVLIASVVDNEGNSVQSIPVSMTLSPTEPEAVNLTPTAGKKSKSNHSFGRIITQKNRTDISGEIIASYSPPSREEISVDQKVYITATIAGTDKSSTVSLTLSHVPVVMVHGYQSTALIFENFKEYLQSKGLPTSAFDYPSELGVINGAQQLASYLREQQSLLLKTGFQTARFDIIAHSMGGLVARYYTTSEQYLNYRDVRKIIFISVPHKGSPLAALGTALFNDTAIYDMMPESILLSQTLPQRINRGLNSTIQVASILGQFDEVVADESASLEEWGIKTELFSVGENNLTMDKILNGSIMESANHRAILSNKRVFERVEEMLTNKLPYPSKRN